MRLVQEILARGRKVWMRCFLRGRIGSFIQRIVAGMRNSWTRGPWGG